MSTLLIDDLTRNRNDLLPFFRTDAASQARSYGPGKWTMRRLLIHLTDAETVFFERLRRLQGEDKPLMLAWDENRWAERLHYEQRSLEVAAELFAATRSALIELATLVPAERYERAGVHTEAGRLTFAEVLAKVLGHSQHHLKQVQACAADTTWTPAG